MEEEDPNYKFPQLHPGEKHGNVGREKQAGCSIIYYSSSYTSTYWLRIDAIMRVLIWHSVSVELQELSELPNDSNIFADECSWLLMHENIRIPNIIIGKCGSTFTFDIR